MDIGTFRGLLTALLLILFLGIWARSWSRKRSVEFDRAAELPLEDDTRPPPSETNEEQTT